MRKIKKKPVQKGRMLFAFVPYYNVLSTFPYLPNFGDLKRRGGKHKFEE